MLRYLICVELAEPRKPNAAGLRSYPLDIVLIRGDELGRAAKVVFDDGSRPSQHAIARPQRNQRQHFRWRTAADRRVVLEASDTVEQRAVARCQPADAEAGKSERFRHYAEAYRSLGQVGGGAQFVGRRVFESAIDFVREQHGYGGFRDLDEPPLHVGRDVCAGRVVRKVDRDEPRAAAHGARNFVRIQLPSVLEAQRNGNDASADGSRNRLERLVHRRHNDGFVARRQQRVQREKDAFLRAGNDHDVLGIQFFVLARYLLAQRGETERLRISESETVPARFRLVVRKREQLAQGQGLDVRCAQLMFDGELPAREIALERKVFDAGERHDERPNAPSVSGRGSVAAPTRLPAARTAASASSAEAPIAER